MKNQFRRTALRGIAMALALAGLFGSASLDREYVFFASPAKPIGQLSLNFTRISDEENKPIVDAMAKARAPSRNWNAVSSSRIG